MEHPRRLHRGPRRHPRRRLPATRASTWSPTASPCATTLPLDALRERLHTLPDQPDVVPYRTSYYDRTWGFCLSHNSWLKLPAGRLRGGIDSTLEPGHLTYARARDRGRGRGRGPDLHLRLPPLARERQPSGIAVATLLAKRTARAPLRHTYRFLFAPGTIGPLAWLHQNRDRARPHRARADAVVHRRRRRPHLQAQPARGRRVDRADGERAARHGRPHRILPWEPWGGDERQFCSPGFDLPVGTLMRTPHGEFDGYHTSADSLERIRPNRLRRRSRPASRSSTCSRPIAAARTSARTASPSSAAAASTVQPAARSRRPTTSARCCGCSTCSDGEREPARHRASSGLPYAVISRAAERLRTPDSCADR